MRRARAGKGILTPAALLLAIAWGCDPAGGASDGPGGADAPPPTPASAPGQDTASAGEPAPAPAGETVPIRVGGIEIQVEVADEPEEHSRGLMFRESLPPNEGMLFVYPRERTLSFWMRNTLIPLDIAYIDSRGRIVDIQQMEPQDDATHPSAAPAMYALEMNRGWFEANGVTVGDLVEF